MRRVARWCVTHRLAVIAAWVVAVVVTAEVVLVVRVAVTVG